MNEEIIKAKKYIFWGIIIGIIILSYLLLRDLLVSILTSIVLAFIARPMYLWIDSKIKNKKISSLITVLVIIIGLVAILAIFITSFISQLVSFLSKQNIANLVNVISNLINSDVVKENLGSIINEIGKALLSKIPSTLTYAPILLLNLFVIFFTTYYLLIEWDKLEKRIMDIIPFSNKHEVAKKIKSKTQNIVGGTFLVAAIEFVIAAVVLKLLGVGPYLVLAFAIALFAFIPALGPAIVWVPLAVIEFLYGKPGVAIGVVILGVILSAGIDFLLRAKILGSRTETHPAIILFGIIGGIKLFGFIGIILGPLILSILVTIIEAIPKSEKLLSKK